MNPGLGVDSCQGVFTGLRRKYGEYFSRTILCVQCSVVRASFARNLPKHPVCLESTNDSINNPPLARIYDLDKTAFLGAFWAPPRYFVRRRTRDTAPTLPSVHTLPVTARRLRRAGVASAFLKLHF
jgi:hypothetical protein